MLKQSNSLSFRISSGLKNIIGRDLISDKFIAIFELVKNSYDAGASKVDISFIKNEKEKDLIVISDNGSGMTYDDIINKWLFVAYSEKKIKNREKNTFRDKIKREIAGAKGVGRFSCDRLGSLLTLITKVKSEEVANKVEVNWDKFEVDDKQEFIDIPVEYSTIDNLPSGYTHGTTLIVTSLREHWDRDDLLKLKRSLMKLISPDANKGELPFDIKLIVPDEIKNDELISKKIGINPHRDLVNGIIYNDIFERLNIKTTNIEVNISEDGLNIKTTLTDRGKYIFSFIERNREYPKLNNININVFYLNQAAKVNFTRQMGGVQPKNYGSVFIYKNGFRINPYGEPGQDFFGIDQRKAQGWKRFLGTREIMGRISIKGINENFVETSSRAHGFIQTDAVDELINLFIEKVLKVLERYVVNLINWGEPLKSNPNHIISPEEIGEKIVSQLLIGVDYKDIINIDYNPDIFNIKLQNESNNIKTVLRKINEAAEYTKDKNLINLAQMLSKRTESIISENIHLEEQNAEHIKALSKAKEKEEVRTKQIYFLKGATNQNVTNLLNGFHTIYTLTDALRGNISYLREMLSSVNFENKDSLLYIVGQIQQTNEKAHKLSDLAIHGNQHLKPNGTQNVYDFIKQYIEAGFLINGLTYNLIEKKNTFYCKFDPTALSIVIDNIASNSLKAGATFLKIVLSEDNKYVQINFEDNGIGLAKNTKPEDLFELGFSYNRKKRGFGIGLYHIRQLINDMKGTVEIDNEYKDGFKLMVRLKK